MVLKFPITSRLVMSNQQNVQGFIAKKKCTLEKSDDSSRKGNIDVSIKDLLEYINDLDDYFTTSSCSGRIIVVGKVIAHNTRPIIK